MTASTTSFAAYGNRRLRRAGVAGNPVTVAAEHGRLVLTGPGGAPVAWPIAWPIATIARIRVGFEESKSGRFYQTMVWQIGAPRPLVLSPVRENPGAYAATVRTLAQEVAAAHGVARVERGIGGIAAALAPVLIGLLFLVAAGIALFVIDEEPWWGRMIVPLVPAAIFALTWWDYRRNKRPQPVAHLADLERQLPTG